MNFDVCNHSLKIQESIVTPTSKWKADLGMYSSYFQISQLSYFLFILNDLKCYRSATQSFANHLEILMAIEQHTKSFFWC